MNYSGENYWIEKLRQPKSFSEACAVVAEIKEHDLNNRLFWEVLHRFLQESVRSVKEGFERTVYEYCLKVFELFDPDITSEKIDVLRLEIESLGPIISCKIPLEIMGMSPEEQKLLELFRQNKDTSEDELVRMLKDVRTEKCWAVVNFVLYSAVYTKNVGRVPGGLLVPAGAITGSLLCLSKWGQTLVAAL